MRSINVGICIVLSWLYSSHATTQGEEPKEPIAERSLEADGFLTSISPISDTQFVLLAGTTVHLLDRQPKLLLKCMAETDVIISHSDVRDKQVVVGGGTTVNPGTVYMYRFDGKALHKEWDHPFALKEQVRSVGFLESSKSVYVFLKLKEDPKAPPPSRKEFTPTYGRIDCLDTATGKPVDSMFERYKDVASISSSADRSLVATGHSDGTVRVWDTAKMKCIAQYRKHPDDVVTIAVAGNLDLIASDSGGDDPIILYSLKKQKVLAELPKSSHEYCKRFWLSNDGKYLFGGGTRLKVIRTRIVNNRDVEDVEFHGMVRIWDTVEGRFIKEFRAHSNSVTSLRTDKECKLLFTTGSDPKIHYAEWSIEKLLKK